MSWFGLPFAPVPKCNRRLAQQLTTNKHKHKDTNAHAHAHAQAQAQVHVNVFSYAYVSVCVNLDVCAQVLETATRTEGQRLRTADTAQRMTACRSVIHSSFSLSLSLFSPHTLLSSVSRKKKCQNYSGPGNHYGHVSRIRWSFARSRLFLAGIGGRRKKNGWQSLSPHGTASPGPPGS